MSRPPVHDSTPAVPPEPRAPRTFALRWHLLALFVGTLLPVGVFAGLLVHRVARHEQDTAERQLLLRARGLANALDRELVASLHTLQALAASQQLDPPEDLTALHQQARRFLATQPFWLALRLVSPTGEVVLDSSRPEGAPVEQVVDLASLRRVVETAAPTIGNLMRRPDGAYAFALRVPVGEPGRLRYVLSAVVAPRTVSEVVHGGGTHVDEWTRTVVDAAGTVAARTRDEERYVGKPATANFVRHVAHADEGVFRSVTFEGEDSIVAFARAPVSRWTVGVVVSRDVLLGPPRRSLLAVVGFCAALLLLTGGGALAVGRRLSRAFGAARVAAGSLADGRRPDLSPSSIREVNDLRAALVGSSELLRARERERDESLEHAEQARRDAEAARTRAELASRAKDEFLAMLGHELRNPLAPIVTALELLRLRGAADSREHEVIDRQVQHLMRLVDDLLDLSRVTRGTLALSRAPVELAPIVARAVEMVAPLLEIQRHTLEVDVAPSGLVVDADPQRLAQVISNLLTNAARYTPPGGRIRVAAARAGEDVELTVADNGQGITADLLPHVFESFVQGPRAIDRREGGLGIGLTLVRRLVEAHGGSVDALSAGAGQGSTFVVRLPAVTAAVDVAPRPAPTPAPLAAERGSRVLVVDDNHEAAEVLVELFAAAGHDARLAFDGPSALALLERFVPDVAFVDIGLPVMDGYELATRIRERLDGRAPALVALTGYGQPGDLERSRAAGFARHLVKPASAETLLATADELVARA